MPRESTRRRESLHRASPGIAQEAERLFAAASTRLASELADVPGVNELLAEEQARLFLAAGMARFESGDVSASIETLERAREIAKTVSDDLAFTVTLALFSRQSQFQSPEETLPGLSHLRQLASRSGRAESIGMLHLVVARLEACRGLYASARRHAALSRRLLAIESRPHYLGLLELVSSSLETCGGNLQGAEEAARAGADVARAHGLTFMLVSCLANVGLLRLLAGDATGAEETLRSVLAMGAELDMVRLSAIESLAQVALFRDDLSAYARQSAAVGAIIDAQDLPARSWYDLAHQHTRCAYFERVEDWARVVDLVDATDEELRRRQYRALRTPMLAAKARALAYLGRHTEADRALAAALRCCPRGAIDPMIVVEASQGIAALARGRVADGFQHLERADAACRATGHHAHRAWITRLRARHSAGQCVSAAAPAASRSLMETALILTDVSTIIGAGHSVEVLAHRISALLMATPLAARTRIENRAGLTYQTETVASTSLDDGRFTMTVRGSDREMSIEIGDVHHIDEIAVLNGLSDVVQAAVNRVVDLDEGAERNLWPRDVPSGPDGTIFQSPRMQEVLRVAVRLADARLPILITGETGTGKDVIARLIHEHSPNRRGPFVPFNSAAIAKDLVESQLFGHRRGAFTGATEAYQGYIRSAEHGTLFLDEIADLDWPIQPKLLRFLESGEIQGLGEIRAQKVDLRLVSATHANLDQMVRDGRFRQDLLYRIDGARLNLPPLRERKDEIPALAALFVRRHASECRRHGVTLGDDLVAALLLYDWPGNIRELSHELRRAVALASDGERLSAAMLSPHLIKVWNDRPRPVPVQGASGSTITIRLDQTLAAAIADLETHFIQHAMQATDGRVTEAADLLGLSRKGLFLKRRRRSTVSTDRGR